MNYYVVVEGRSTEPFVYRKWIPHVNPYISEIHYVDDVAENNFLIRSANGWPGILKMIDNALEDVKLYKKYDRLIVSVDSEDETLEERRAKIAAHIESKNPSIEYRIIIQHFCFEAWALGNTKYLPKAPSDNELRNYKKFYDVSQNDPEGLLAYPSEDLTRAQFATKYLSKMISARGNHLNYSKNKGYVVAHDKYFLALKERMEKTAHISSFATFFWAFEA